MKKERIERLHGSGNVFADFGLPNAPAEQLKALLAAKIIRVLEIARDDGTQCCDTHRNHSRGFLTHPES